MKLTNLSKQDHVFSGMVCVDGKYLEQDCLHAGQSVEISEAEFARFNSPVMKALIAEGRLCVGEPPKVKSEDAEAAKPNTVLNYAKAEEEVDELVANLTAKPVHAKHKK